MDQSDHTLIHEDINEKLGTYGLDDAVTKSCSLSDCWMTCLDEDFLHFVGLGCQC